MISVMIVLYWCVATSAKSSHTFFFTIQEGLIERFEIR